MKNYRLALKKLLQPNEIHDSVDDIDLDGLQDKGIKYLVLDVDNTLLSYDEKELSLQKQAWIQSVKSMGFTIVLVSNNSNGRRIQKVATQIDVPGTYFSLKPFSINAEYLKAHFFIEFEQAAVVGDQVLTDVIFGNWQNAHTILVSPLAKKHSAFKRLQYKLESYLLKTLDIYQAPVKGFPNI